MESLLSMMTQRPIDQSLHTNTAATDAVIDRVVEMTALQKKLNDLKVRKAALQAQRDGIPLNSSGLYEMLSTVRRFNAALLKIVENLPEYEQVAKKIADGTTLDAPLTDVTRVRALIDAARSTTPDPGAVIDAFLQRAGSITRDLQTDLMDASSAAMVQRTRLVEMTDTLRRVFDGALSKEALRTVVRRVLQDV